MLGDFTPQRACVGKMVAHQRGQSGSHGKFIKEREKGKKKDTGEVSGDQVLVASGWEKPSDIKRAP